MKSDVLVKCPVDPSCVGCFYYRGDKVKTCNYLFITGNMRPCPPGKGCTVRITRKDLYMKKPCWDTDAGREMWEAGKTDSEIADEFHISTGAVTSFRKKHWEPKATRGGDNLRIRKRKSKGGNVRA